MGGGDGQVAGILLAKLLGDVLDAVHIAQHALGVFEDALAGGGHFGQMLAVAQKHLHAQLLFQHADLLADAGLGCEQRLGGSSDVEAALGHFVDISQLAEFHVIS